MSNNLKREAIKSKISHELKQYLIYSLFLYLLFFAFTSYERILLNSLSLYYFPYGYCVIKALILAKVIMIGEALRLGERYNTNPLIVPVLYKTILFCIFVLIVTALEDILKGYLAGHSIAQVYQVFIQEHLYIALAQTVIMFFIFILFFSVLETSRYMGNNKLFNIFFKSRM